MDVSDFDQALERYHLAMRELAKGNPEPLKNITSRRGDVTVSGGFGGYFRGWEQVARNMEMAASRFRDAVDAASEDVTKYATQELAYTVDIERFSARLAGTEGVVPVALRVTSIFRREDGSWKLVHRHANPITSVQPSESIIQK